MKRIFICVTIIFIAVSFFFCQNAAAALATGTAVQYNVVVTKFELSTDGGSTWITAFEGTSASIDLGSSNASKGQSPGAFLSGLSVPDGTYNMIRVTPSGTFTIKGSISYLGSTYYTTNAVGVDTGASVSTNINNYDACSITIGGVSAQTYTPPSAIVVKDGSCASKIRVSFNVDSGIGLYPQTGGGYETYPEAPVVSMSIQ